GSMKAAYIIKEVQNINSEREGTQIEATSLSQAKRIASKEQCFHGTVMRIETVNGLWLAYKEDGKRWVDCQ
uniref:AcrIF9 n=1 Tax=Photobacterium damselae TaxID=38293 RepID=UPI001BCA67C6|nr:Chain A, AcrIF9 [Photobacterium damselae]